MITNSQAIGSAGTAAAGSGKYNVVYAVTGYSNSSNNLTLTVPSSYLSQTQNIILEAFGAQTYSGSGQAAGSHYSAMFPLTVMFHKSYSHSGIIYIPAWFSNSYGLTSANISRNYSWSSSGTLTVGRSNNSFFTLNLICLGS